MGCTHDFTPNWKSLSHEPDLDSQGQIRSLRILSLSRALKLQIRLQKSAMCGKLKAVLGLVLVRAAFHCYSALY
jgi:hypothetical protein